MEIDAGRREEFEAGANRAAGKKQRFFQGHRRSASGGSADENRLATDRFKKQEGNRERKDTRQRHRVLAHQLFEGSDAEKTRRRADRGRKGRVRENQGSTKGLAGEDLEAGEIGAKRQGAGERAERDQKQAERIVKEPITLDSYIATFYLLDLQSGLIRGYEYYVDKPWRADYLGLVDWISEYVSWYYTWYDTVSYDWAWVDTSVDIYEDVTVSESVSDEEISSEESYAESESFDMSDAEEEEVAAEEDTAEEVASADEGSMEDASDDKGEDMNDGETGDAAGDENTGDDDGGDDAGDNGGGDEGE